jgi:hypothetical protein
VPRERARARALEFDWDRVCRQFVSHLAIIDHGKAGGLVSNVRALAGH